MFKKINPKLKKEQKELTKWYKDQSAKIRDALDCQKTFEGLKEYKAKFKELNIEYTTKVLQLQEKYKNIK